MLGRRGSGCAVTVRRQARSALLDAAFVPHYRSPGHPKTAAIERVVTRYRTEGIAYRTLRDGQALLVNGPETTIG
jgi:dipeptidase E